MQQPTPTIRLATGDATADIAALGAEPMSWRVGGRELLWQGDPEHWGFRAPILFPVVGASAGGEVQVDGVAYPMPQHGFARRSLFSVVAQNRSSAHFRLTENRDTLPAYPFRFTLDLHVSLQPTSLDFRYEVTNPGDRAMPYGLGVHPAFPWPFAGQGREGHRVRFEREESPAVPEIAAGGLLARHGRELPLQGRTLPLSPDLFTEALVFLHARSRSVSFEAPSGAAITLLVRDFPHFAIWTRPTAPFLSLEAWTAHADWEDAAGELRSRASMTILSPGESRSHEVTFAWRDAAA
ncbi:aldose 1-epimerase family protein [uncultured Enterovirga sp.]|uniref:aldose 1-epimerase family protein n=1 Tax=uncultured Enterovirga sp. TaxID=2026352 RepID=UPI0035C9A1F6